MKILIIEDDVKIASFISKGLKEAGYNVDIAYDGEDGLLKWNCCQYDAAVVDLMLPKLDGLSLIEKIRETGNNTPVIILSAKQSVDDRIKGLQAGGDDYMVKPFSFSELLARIQALLRRSSQITSERTSSEIKLGEIVINLMSRKVTREGETIELQPKEFSLLELLMRNPGHIVTKTSILEHVYDYNFDPQTNVVDVLVCRLRNKVDKNYENKVIQTIRGMGYVFKDN